MKPGFYTIMAAQFFSSLADNALLIAAIALLYQLQAPAWMTPLLKLFFVLSYVLLAAFVGAFADSRPKGNVMFWTNTIKIIGCMAMLFTLHPLAAYAIVGFGAAAYSPAKYGILTELLPPEKLVVANGWIEGLTIASIILGVLLGGQLVGPNLSAWLLSFDLPFITTGVDSSAEAAICLLIPLYALAAWFNKRIPYTGAALIPMRLDPEKTMARNLLALVPDFWHCNQRLWQDKLGQISLATTTLFWGVSGNLRYIVLAWSAAALGYTTTQASSLVGVVAIGTAVGAVVASMKMRLDHATRLMPLGIAMGCFVVAMNFIDNLWLAVPFLIVLGGLGGFLVVPMNALLQHRGHNLMGAGRSIAVQNLNEQLCILGLGFLYTFSTGMGLSAFGAITAFGALVGYVMWLIKLWHEHNHKHHREELARLMHIARNDDLHG